MPQTSAAAHHASGTSRDAFFIALPVPFDSSGSRAPQPLAQHAGEQRAAGRIEMASDLQRLAVRAQRETQVPVRLAAGNLDPVRIEAVPLDPPTGLNFHLQRASGEREAL